MSGDGSTEFSSFGSNFVFILNFLLNILITINLKLSNLKGLESHTHKFEILVPSQIIGIGLNSPTITKAH